MKTFSLRSLTLLIAMMLTTALYAQQQSTDFSTTRVIKGAVIDKNGNPLPGATVSATGGAETVTTDADGTYSIEVPAWLTSLTASYPGLSNKKVSLDAYDTVIFKLRGAKRTFGFVNLMFANVWHIKQDYSELVKPVQQLGVMGGAYRSWGGYAKVMIAISSGGKSYYRNPMADQKPTITGGAIKRLTKNINIFLGAGIGYNYGVHTEHRYNPFYWIDDNLFAFAGEAGMMAKFRKLNFILGVTYLSKTTELSYKSNKGNIAVFAGIGLNI